MDLELERAHRPSRRGRRESSGCWDPQAASRRGRRRGRTKRRPRRTPREPPSAGYPDRSNRNRCRRRTVRAPTPVLANATRRAARTAFFVSVDIVVPPRADGSARTLPNCRAVVNSRHVSEITRVERPPERPLGVFDGDCGFCRLWIARWKARTGPKVDYAPSQEVAERFPEIPKEQFARGIPAHPSRRGDSRRCGGRRRPRRARARPRTLARSLSPRPRRGSAGRAGVPAHRESPARRDGGHAPALGRLRTEADVLRRDRALPAPPRPLLPRRLRIALGPDRRPRRRERSPADRAASGLGARADRRRTLLAASRRSPGSRRATPPCMLQCAAGHRRGASASRRARAGVERGRGVAAVSLPLRRRSDVSRVPVGLPARRRPGSSPSSSPRPRGSAFGAASLRPGSRDFSSSGCSFASCSLRARSSSEAATPPGAASRRSACTTRRSRCLRGPRGSCTSFPLLPDGLVPPSLLRRARRALSLLCSAPPAPLRLRYDDPAAGAHRGHRELRLLQHADDLARRAPPRRRGLSGALAKGCRGVGRTKPMAAVDPRPGGGRPARRLGGPVSRFARLARRDLPRRSSPSTAPSLRCAAPTATASSR